MLKIAIMNTPIVFNKDLDAYSIFVMKVFPAEVTEVWDHFTQADLLDRWWAPQPWKCETVNLDFREGGTWNYAMIGPQNEKQFAGANYHEINFHRSFDWTDHFSDENGQMNTALPTVKWLFGFTGVEEGTKLTVNIHFNSAEDLNQLLELGFEEGFSTALNQLEGVLSKKD